MIFFFSNHAALISILNCNALPFACLIQQALFVYYLQIKNNFFFTFYSNFVLKRFNVSPIKKKSQKSSAITPITGHKDKVKPNALWDKVWQHFLNRHYP